VPAFPSPADWRDVVIYFVLVDRFANPSSPPQHLPWDEPFDGWQGGSFAGIRDGLDYLADLGVGAIWLSPVFRTDGSYHGYGIEDFLAVEPRFASDPAAAGTTPGVAEAELRELVDAAHERGIYVILDIVLNHAGDVFEYPGIGSVAPWRSMPYDPIAWRPGGVKPAALQRNELFRRQGNAFSPNHTPEAGGDFYALKELVTDYVDAQTGRYPVRDTLIAAYQRAIADYDIDGLRIDTLKYIERPFSLLFGNAMREFALSIGKRNFFTFGEVWDSEERIAEFVGRYADESGDIVGVDAALDFPQAGVLPWLAKGLAAPTDLIAMYTKRKSVERGVVSSHGEASRFFVTFVDNHDFHERFHHEPADDPHRYDAQLPLALGCLFALQGIPCLYYGTEQGLHGAGSAPEAVREALWGAPAAFDPVAAFVPAVRELCSLRDRQPALRYGRQYFRPISGDATHFAASRDHPGVLAFSRILSASEVVVVANTRTDGDWSGHVIVDVPAGRRGIDARAPVCES